MSREQDSNLRPAVYKTAALPTELSRQNFLEYRGLSILSKSWISLQYRSKTAALPPKQTSFTPASPVQLH